MICIDEITTEIDAQRVLACLGYNDTAQPDGFVRDQVDLLICNSFGTFRAAFKEVPVTGLKEGLITTRHGMIHSKNFSTIAKGSETLYFCLVTTGRDEEGGDAETSDLLETMIHDAIGTVIVEQGVDYVTAMIEQRTGQHISLPFSPGYCDFPVEGQQLIFSELGPRPLGVICDKESWMMTPIKSISFIVSAGDSVMERNPCKFCHLTRCFMRRTAC